MKPLKNNKVIYTCLVGGYDPLTQPGYVAEGFDYVCFTNDLPEGRSGIWQIRPIPFTCDDPPRLSRFVKLKPHVALPEYEYSFWMDACLSINGPAIPERLNELISAGTLIAQVRHPDLDCIYDDALLCMQLGNESYHKLKRQVDFLKREGYPAHNGLYENNVMLRQHNNPRVKAISEAWWALYITYSKRDQLSLCYVYWKHGFSPELLLPEPYCARNHPGFTLSGSHRLTLVKRVKRRARSAFNNWMLIATGKGNLKNIFGCR